MKSFIALFIVLAIAAVYGAEESKVTEKRGIYGGLGYGYSGYPGLAGHGYYGGLGGYGGYGGYANGLGYGSHAGYYGSYPGYYGSHSGYLGGYSGYPYGVGYGFH
ncbi:keratin-associated protein 19-2 [Anopheles nili]|uniref:keratin-associated protein 19-2 n=1 Tax=Anopheles nili TaxID=185578 RepID=UPI00237A35F5|nr:keratin-associated protein 19-2 [Anopheles nili]